MKRFKDALFIQEGACNPVAVTNSLVRAMKEIETGTEDILQDPACRLIAHQLAHLFKTSALDHELFVYSQAIEECKKEAEPLRFVSTDSGFCRVYFKSGEGHLVCFQESVPNQFGFYRCTPSGEPEYEISLRKVLRQDAEDANYPGFIEFLETNNLIAGETL